MDIAQIHNRKEWNSLPENKAAEILRSLLKALPEGFTIKHFERFSKFGQSTYTAVLDYKGHEFVFVPGDTVVLGLDKLEMTNKNREDMTSFFGVEPAEIDAYMKERLSPVRTVAIGPMIAERQVRETGYFPVPMNDERLTSDPYFEKTLQELENTPKEKYVYTVNDSFRLQKNGKEIRAFLYESSTYEELVKEITDTGFRLPTENEWEYLGGGGSRTLYPWGNQLQSQQKYHHFAAGRDNNEPYFLDIPNHFGLVIANNPYRYEIMMDSDWFLKGGDGGCNICGGGGLDIGYLGTGTYYRDLYIFDEEMAYKEEITGDYTFVRRILRLG